jgi:hypothetical protein
MLIASLVAGPSLQPRGTEIRSPLSLTRNLGYENSLAAVFVLISHNDVEYWLNARKPKKIATVR